MVIFLQRWDGNVFFSGHHCHWWFFNGFTPWRTFGVADIGGSYVRGWGLGVSDVRGFERSGLRFVFRHSGFLVFLHFGCSGLNPEHKNPECPKIDHHSLNPEPRTPNVRIWRFVVFGHSGLNPEHPKINPECLKMAPQPPNPEHPKMSPEPRTSENTPPNVRTPNIRKWAPNPERPKILPPQRIYLHEPKKSIFSAWIVVFSARIVVFYLPFT